MCGSGHGVHLVCKFGDVNKAYSFQIKFNTVNDHELIYLSIKLL